MCLSPSGLWGNDANKRVSPKLQREALLKVAEQMLAEPDPQRAVDLRNRRSPFVKPAPLVVETTQDGAPAPVVIEPVRLTNQQALAMVAERLRPRGTLILGSNRIVRLEGGGQLSAGTVLPLTVRGEEYRVVVESVQSDSFTLRLGGQTVTLPTNPSLPTGGVTFDNAPAPTGDEPTP